MDLYDVEIFASSRGRAWFCVLGSGPLVVRGVVYGPYERLCGPYRRRDYLLWLLAERVYGPYRGRVSTAGRFGG